MIALPALHTQIWQELQRACAQRGHGWRTPVLATRDGDGADARTVVLREVDAEARQLRLYTDARSPKVAQMAAWPEGSLVAWCPALQWQLRLRVRLHVEADGLAVRSRWAQLHLRPQAQDYLSPLPPGTPLNDAPPAAGIAHGHFALVYAEVQAIDWLGLRREGHRRAQFLPQQGAWHGSWVTP